jgi:hypothetical protein
MLALEVTERPDDAAKLSAELASVAETLAKTGQGSQRIRKNKTLSGNEQRVAAVLVVSGISAESREAPRRQASPDGGVSGPFSPVRRARARAQRAGVAGVGQVPKLPKGGVGVGRGGPEVPWAEKVGMDATRQGWSERKENSEALEIRKMGWSVSSSSPKM